MKNLKVVFTARRSVQWERELISECDVGPNRLLIRSQSSLISSGTELAVYTGTHVRFSYTDERRWSYPMCMSYATVGQVQRVGEGTKGFSQKDWVFVDSVHQRYVIADPSKQIVCRLADGMDLRYAPFAALANVSNTALQLSPAGPSDHVVILGLGMVGNLAGQLYRRTGANVIGADLIEARCAIARECGFDQIVNTQEQDLLSVVRNVTGGRGADIVVEATGSPPVVSTALSVARPKGQVILLGSTRGLVPNLDVYSLIHCAGLVVKGAHVNVFPRFRAAGESYNRYDGLAHMVSLIASDQLAIPPLLSDIVPPDGLRDAYEKLISDKATHMGILIDWTQLGQ